MAFADAVQFGEDRLDCLQVLLAILVELDAAGVAHEQGTAEIRFQCLGPVSDGRGGDAEFHGSALEAPVTGGLKKIKQSRGGMGCKGFLGVMIDVL